MMKSPQHIVEFWPTPSSEGAPPHTVECQSEAAAESLEAQFHGVGWAARAVTLTVQRSFPTAGKPPIKLVA